MKVKIILSYRGKDHCEELINQWLNDFSGEIISISYSMVATEGESDEFSALILYKTNS